MSNAEIRTYHNGDREELRRLFCLVGKDSPSGSLWGHKDSEAAIYLTPYMDYEPESFFVAVVNDELVGYLVGSLGDSAMPTEEQRMVSAIKEYRVFLRAKPLAFFARSLVDVAIGSIRKEPKSGELNDERWPAHLHINLLPQARGTGASTALMERWFDRLKERNSPGCYLQTLVENTRAVRFFERMGFEKYGPTPLVPGIRYQGKRLHQQTMVRSLNNS